MKRGILVLIVGLFLMIFMIGTINSEILKSTQIDNKFSTESSGLNSQPESFLSDRIIYFDTGLFENYYTKNCKYDTAYYSLGTIRVNATSNKHTNLMLGSPYPYTSSYYNNDENENIYLDLSLPISYPISNIIHSNTFQIGNFNGHFRILNEDLSGFASGVFFTTNGEVDDSLLRISGSLVGGEESYSSSFQNKTSFNGQFFLVLNQSSDDCWLVFQGVETRNNNIEPRVLILESWKDSLSDILSNILLTLTEYNTRMEDHESRISDLESQPPIIPNGTLPNYFKYLSSTDRKNIVCGYAEDNHLTQLTDLGWACDITYRQLRTGKETSSCKCKKN